MKNGIQDAQYLLTAPQMKECDQSTSKIVGISPAVLMERAALSMVPHVLKACRDLPNQTVLILCGKGGNGADGLALARLLHLEGIPVCVGVVEPFPNSINSMKLVSGSKTGKLTSASKTGKLASTTATEKLTDAVTLYEQQAKSLQFYVDHPQNQVPITVSLATKLLTEETKRLKKGYPRTYAVIVDALLGVGARLPLSEDYAKLSQMINVAHAHKSYVIACDLPTGVSATDGNASKDAITCDETITFGFYKRAHFMEPSQAYCGKVTRYSIGIGEEVLKTDASSLFYTLRRPLQECDLPPRNANGNKGNFGKIALVAGRKDMAGCAVLAAHACYRTGAGMVRVITEEQNRIIVQEQLPEALLTTYEPAILTNEEKKDTAIEKGLSWANVCAIGPGIGVDLEAKLLLTKVLSLLTSKQSLVMDADALRLFAREPLVQKEFRAYLKRVHEETNTWPSVIMTPHMGEFAELMQVSIKEAKEQVESLSKKFAKKWHVTIISKDAHTLVVSPLTQEMFYNTLGNEGMATAGAGDVLTGMTAALLAVLPNDPMKAAVLGTWMHATCGDEAVGLKLKRGLKASDLYQVELQEKKS